MPEGKGDEGAGRDPRVVSIAIAEFLAALAYGERRGAQRSTDSIRLAPDGRSRAIQEHVASRERDNWELVEARLRELGEQALMERFAPYFDAFFEHTEP